MGFWASAVVMVVVVVVRLTMVRGIGFSTGGGPTGGSLGLNSPIAKSLATV